MLAQLASVDSDMAVVLSGPTGISDSFQIIVTNNDQLRSGCLQLR